MKNENYDKLKFFFEYRWLDQDKEFLVELENMSEDELKILHDIVFADTEKERLTKIDKFYIWLENKYSDANSYMQKMKNRMGSILDELDEILEKESNENDFLNDINNI